jgi:hypothetical protein
MALQIKKNNILNSKINLPSTTISQSITRAKQERFPVIQNKFKIERKQPTISRIRTKSRIKTRIETRLTRTQAILLSRLQKLAQKQKLTTAQKQKLKQLLVQKLKSKLSQKELAKKFKMSKCQINKIINKLFWN